MYNNTAAGRALKAGCQRLQLPDETAVELIKFLQAKRIHDQFLSAAARARNMSPGAAVDKLWHYMLLNTDVSSAVHELVGGVVRHIGTDEDDLDDDTKRMQRLYAMSIMAREGWEPKVSLWEDPGTNMSHIWPVTDPDKTRLYMCQDVTPDDLAALKADLARVYSSSSRKRKAPEPADAADSDESESQSESNSEHEHERCDSAGPVDYPPITVVVSDGGAYEIGVPATTPGLGYQAADIKRTLSADLNTPAAQLRMVSVAYGVSNMPRLVNDTDFITHGSIVRLLLPRARVPKAPSPYQVFVKTLAGKTLDLSSKVAPWVSVQELKLVIQAVHGCPPDFQRIIYTGRQLEDGRMLDEYSVRHGSVLHLVLKLRGC